VLLALAYCIGILVMAHVFPSMVGGSGTGAMYDEPLMGPLEMLLKLGPAATLIIVCLGGIYAGAFTATEAGAVGALLSLVIALARGRLDRAKFWQVLVETGHVTVSVSFLIICANIYTRMLAMSGTPQFLVETMAGAGLGIYAFIAIYVLIVLLLGTIIDSSSIMLICLPLMLPIAETFQLNLVWFGVVTVVAVEIGLLTPPFGLSVYVIKSTLNDPRVGLGDIFRGTAPFTLIMFCVLLLLIAFPKLSLVLL